MARIIETEDELILELSRLEKWGAFHSSIRAPKSALIKSFEFENPWSKGFLQGVRAPGTGIPFVILLGTLRGKGFKDFTAIRGRGPVVVYEFSGLPFRRWIVSRL